MTVYYKRQPISMIERSKLSVTIHDVEFAKDFSYFISVQYEGTKVSTPQTVERDRSVRTRQKPYFHQQHFLL